MKRVYVVRDDAERVLAYSHLHRITWWPFWEQEPDELQVQDLYVDPTRRGVGHASELLRMIVRDADAEGVHLNLVIAPTVDGGPTLTAPQLGEFYARYGFVQMSHGTVDGRALMRRTPTVGAARPGRRPV